MSNEDLRVPLSDRLMWQSLDGHQRANDALIRIHERIQQMHQARRVTAAELEGAKTALLVDDADVEQAAAQPIHTETPRVVINPATLSLNSIRFVGKPAVAH